LTSFIFQSQDYDFGFCELANPPGVSCSKKHAAQAFTFLVLYVSPVNLFETNLTDNRSFFTFSGLFLELSALWAYRRESGPLHPEKNEGRAPVDAPVATA
jgi:hypothetical protein